MSESETTNGDTLLGKLVVEKGLATSGDLQECLKICRQNLAAGNSNAASLGAALVEQSIITQRQLDRLQFDLKEEEDRDRQIPGYQVKKKLGAGAMATVFMAKQLSLDRIVAIKILPRKYTNNPRYIDRFYAEGKAAAKLNHPNIVQAIDVGQAGEFHYFVMEYVEGRTVGDDLSEHGRYKEKEALGISVQIAKALDHAHKQGFIHRDVKPKNIMITPEGQAKLADMGLARAESDREAAESEQGKAYGTPYYISPEQIRGDIHVDSRADIYGLGATVYHMVTGQVPFEAPNPSAVMHQHLKADLVPPDHLNPSLTAGVSEIIEVCMAKNPDKRYNSTEDLLTDLEAVANGEPPLEARKKFDLSSLTALEQSTHSLEALDGGLRQVAQPPAPLLYQPVFWFAVLGWFMAISLVIVILTLNGA